jgi:hypothetical protein
MILYLAMRVCGFALLLLPALAGASVLASNDISINGSYTSYGFASYENFYMSFQIDSTWTNVDFLVAFPGTGTSAVTGTAYLTTTIGPGTQQADEIAQSDFSLPASDGYVSVLSGQTLAAGNTYYLTLSANGNASIFATRTGENNTFEAAGVSGLSYGEEFGVASSFPPSDSNWSSLACCSSGLVFEVDGDAGAAVAPEPSTAASGLALIALFALYCLVRSRRRVLMP